MGKLPPGSSWQLTIWSLLDKVTVGELQIVPFGPVTSSWTRTSVP